MAPDERKSGKIGTRSKSRGCMMQGPEGHGKNSVLCPKSNVLLKVIKHKGNISEMYYSAMKNGLKESLEKAKEVSL